MDQNNSKTIKWSIDDQLILRRQQRLPPEQGGALYGRRGLRRFPFSVRNARRPRGIPACCFGRIALSSMERGEVIDS